MQTRDFVSLVASMAAREMSALILADHPTSFVTHA